MEPLAASGSLPVAGRRQRKLRNYLLDAKLQLRLASYLIGVGVALSLGLGWLLWRAYRETSRVIALSDHDSGDSIALPLSSEERVRIIIIGVALGAVAIYLLGNAIVISHRIAD